MKLETVFLKFPKWVIAMGIFLVSTGLFGFWWFALKPRSEDNPFTATSEQEEMSKQAKPSKGAPASAPPAMVEIDAASMLLGGEKLYQVAEDGVRTLREDFLQYPIKSGDEAVFHEEKNRLIIGRANGTFEVIRANGETVSALHLSGGGKFDGYLSPYLTHVVYVKSGDIWRGKIDWDTAQIVQEKQVTNLGYFLGKPFKGRLIAANGNRLLYRDQNLGVVGVDLDTGETDSLQLPPQLATGPDGRLAIGDVPSRPPQLIIFDVEHFEVQTFPIPSRIPQNGLAWLSESRAAIILANQIGIYDHSTKEVSQLYQADEGSSTRPIVPSLVGEEFLFFHDSKKGILLLNTKTGVTHLMQGHTAHGIELLRGGSFLLSSDVAGSEQRGTWLGEFGTESFTRIFAQPMHQKNRHRPAGQRFSLPLADSDNIIIRAFDRWHLLEMSSKSLYEFKMDERELIPIRKL